MKAEHRKELETNALASGMGRMIRDVRQKPVGRPLLIILGVVVLVIAVWVFLAWWGRSRDASAMAWVELGLGEDFNKVVETAYPDGKVNSAAGNKSEQGKVARFQVAWLHLNDLGIRNLLRRPHDAVDSISRAKEIYGFLAEECEKDPVLGPEAYYCIAVAEEALAGAGGQRTEQLLLDTERQLKTARKAYNEVVEKYPKSAFGIAAAQRVKELDSDYDRISSFYRMASFEVLLAPDMQRMRPNKK